MRKFILVFLLAMWVGQAAASGESGEASPVVDQAAVEECVKKGREAAARKHAKDSAERKKRGLAPYRLKDTGLTRKLCEARSAAAPILNQTPWR